MIPINYAAVLVVALLSMVLGSLWYGPIFGKPWSKMMGYTEADKEKALKLGFVKSGMAKSYGLMFLGSLVMAYVFSHTLVFVMAYTKTSGISAGISTAVITWMGFIAPVTLSSVLWESKPWKLWILNNGYQLCYLMMAGVILTSWM